MDEGVITVEKMVLDATGFPQPTGAKRWKPTRWCWRSDRTSIFASQRRARA
jgi:hypothetical protein